MRTRGRPKDSSPEDEANPSVEDTNASQEAEAPAAKDNGPKEPESNDDPVQVLTESDAKSSPAAETKQSKPSGEDETDGDKQRQGSKGGGGRNHPHKNQQRNRNKQQHNRKQKHQQRKKRQGGRRGKRPPMDFEEKRPLVLGTLLEFEALSDPDALEEFAVRAEGKGGDEIDFAALYALDLQELKEQAVALEVELGTAPIREEVLDAILDRAAENNVPVKVTGVLELMEEGHGLLLQAKDSYRIKSQSVFVPPALVKKFGLQTGHEVEALILPKAEGATCPVAVRIRSIMGDKPEAASRTVPFTELIPYYPLERMFMETKADVEWDNVSMRVVDLVSPIGFGQRGLIVAQPRTGKTVLLQGIAHAIRENNPDTHLIILLIDERPEEVTDFKRQIEGAEVISSTFDERAESHVHATEIVIERARRMVEVGKHVVILLDSITRMARGYNTTMPNSGKILSGGVEANALQRPKRFFGSARNIEGGGSLSILATALVETGSKMDEVIFEEFKGTGNMELHLDRELVNKRIFPAISFDLSGTRKEELLYHPEELDKVYGLRRSLKGVPPAEAMEMFIKRVRKTKSNAEFLMSLGK